MWLPKTARKPVVCLRYSKRLLALGPPAACSSAELLAGGGWSTERWGRLPSHFFSNSRLTALPALSHVAVFVWLRWRLEMPTPAHDALVAQLVEHTHGKREVTGSIPVKGSRGLEVASITEVFSGISLQTGVAQLAEHRSPKPGAGGSSPSTRATSSRRSLFVAPLPPPPSVHLADGA